MAKKTEQLLREVAQRIIEPLPSGLADRIKQQIPLSLVDRRWGKGPINIIVHLKISRLAAAAVIVVTLVGCAVIFGGRGGSDGIYDDLKALVDYLPGRGASDARVMAGLYNYSQSLQHQGRQVVYYGDVVDKPTSDTLLMHWKLEDGIYRVIFGDFRVAQLTAEELIEVQSRLIKDLKP